MAARREPALLVGAKDRRPVSQAATSAQCARGIRAARFSHFVPVSLGFHGNCWLNVDSVVLVCARCTFACQLSLLRMRLVMPSTDVIVTSVGRPAASSGRRNLLVAPSNSSATSSTSSSPVNITHYRRVYADHEGYAFDSENFRKMARKFA